MGTIRLHLGKKVVLGSGVESTKKIPDVLIEMKTGAPLELLKEVAAQGGYVAIETHDEFIVNTK